MTMEHHPDPATLLAYAAGALDESHALVVASHLDWCPGCAEEVAFGEMVGGAIVDAAEAAPVSAAARERLLAAIAEEEHRNGRSPLAPEGDINLPAALRRALPAPLDELPWRRIAKGVSLYDVKLSPHAKGQVRIWKLAPGKETPEHGHGGTEISMILRGSYSDRVGTFRRGDVEDLGDEIEHQPVAGEDEGCICIIASDAPNRFKGLLPRLLQPILRY